MADFDKGGSSGGAGSALRRRADSADDDSSLGVGHSKPGHPRPSPAARRSYMRNWVRAECRVPCLVRRVMHTASHSCTQPTPPQVGFFLLGTINNLTYVIVGSAAKVCRFFCARLHTPPPHTSHDFCVLTASPPNTQTISDSFGKGNLIGMIPWALVGFSFVARGQSFPLPSSRALKHLRILRSSPPPLSPISQVMNTFVVHNTSYSGRMLFNAVLMAAGLVGVAFAPNFWLAIVAIVC